MVKREKKLRIALASLEKQKQIHLRKLEQGEGRKDTTRDYWMKEIEKFEKEIEKKKKALKKK